MGIGDRLVGNPSKFSFEQRIFHFSMLMAISLTAFGTVMDVYYGIPIGVDTAFLGSWTAFYLLARHGRGFETVSVVACAVFLFAFIPYMWEPGGGLYGSIPHYTILSMAIFSIILRRPLRWVMAGSMVGVELLLILHEMRVNNLPISTLLHIPIHLFVVLATTALLIIVYSNSYMEEKRRSEIYANALQAHVQQQLYYVQNLEQLIGTLKSERHDFNNHLGVIHGLLECKDTQKACEYAARLVKNAAEYQMIVQVPQAAVRAIINHKLSVARQNNIALHLDVNLPEDIAIDEFDLTAILGNLLDNAIEACGNLTDTAPYIRLTLKYKPDYLVLCVANPFSPVTEQAARAHKPDPENHGFGLKNVQYLVEKHNGLMEIKQENGVFKADIALLVG